VFLLYDLDSFYYTIWIALTLRTCVCLLYACAYRVLTVDPLHRGVMYSKVVYSIACTHFLLCDRYYYISPVCSRGCGVCGTRVHVCSVVCVVYYTIYNIYILLFYFILFYLCACVWCSRVGGVVCE
jgi:hypothetical protein